MRIEIPYTIIHYFQLEPDVVYTDEIGQQIGRESANFFNTLREKFYEPKDSIPKIRPEESSNYSFDLSKLKMHITLGGEPDYTTGIFPPLFSNVETSFVLVYQDDTPYDDEKERNLNYKMFFNMDYGKKVDTTHFVHSSNPIFKGDKHWYEVHKVHQRNINVRNRTRRRAVQGIQQLPRNVTNVIANFTFGPMTPESNHHKRFHPLPNALSNETMQKTFEERLANAEAARAALAAAASAAQPQQQVQEAAPKNTRPWYKRLFSKKRRGGKRRVRRTRYSKHGK